MGRKAMAVDGSAEDAMSRRRARRVGALLRVCRDYRRIVNRLMLLLSCGCAIWGNGAGASRFATGRAECASSTKSDVARPVCRSLET